MYFSLSVGFDFPKCLLTLVDFDSNRQRFMFGKLSQSTFLLAKLCFLWLISVLFHKVPKENNCKELKSL